MKAQKLIAAGENGCTVFKSCRNGVHTDVFETICAFLNSGGGTLLLGVEENGSVLGLPGRAVPEIIKGLAKAVGNPEIFSPTFYLLPEEEILEGKHVLILEVPESPEVHALRGQVFVRRGVQNVRLLNREEFARLYTRKQDVYTERKIYPFLKESDLQPELLSRVRALAEMHEEGHSWCSMEDSVLLAEMNLSGVNYETGERGLRFLAALLLGKDSTIRNIFGSTEIFCEKQKEGRLVRLHLETNLLDEAEKLTEFLKDTVGEEEAAAFIAVLLTEREYTCAFPAHMHVTDRGAEVQFAASAGRYGNPLLKKLLREMGLYQDSLCELMSIQNKEGICTLKLQRAVKKKTKEPVQETLPFVSDVYANYTEKLTPGERQREILHMMAENDRVSVGTMVRNLQVTKRTVLRDIDKLKKQNLVIREGSEKSGRWILCPAQRTEEKAEHNELARDVESPD